MNRLLVLFNLLFLFSACAYDGTVPYVVDISDTSGGDGVKQIVQHKAALNFIDDCGAYKDYVLDNAARRIAERRLGYHMYYMTDDALDGAFPEASDPSFPKDEDAGEFSTTNVQEAGVDELDTVKNDGQYFYIVGSGGMQIIRAWPPQDMKEVSHVRFKDTGREREYGMGLFLQGDKVIVVKSGYVSDVDNSQIHKDYWHPYYRYASLTRVSVYDVSDRSKPRLLQEVDFPSDYVDSRLIGSQLYIALNYSREAIDPYEYLDVSMPGVPKAADQPADWENYEKNVAAVYPYVRKYLEDHTKDWAVEDLFPKAKRFDKQGQKVEAPYVSCADFYIPSTASTVQGLLSIVTLDLEDLDSMSASTIADSSWIFYASTKNIYLVSNSQNWYRFWANADTDNYMFSHIHQFSLEPELRKTQYRASGEIKGIINDSFWMSDYKDHLRVAAQASWWNDNNSGSRLSVLKREGSQLVEVGNIENIAKGEQIYAVRMMGEKGYIVTFKRIDPLFTLDLSNPEKPEILGELEINGYSSYIHPLGDKHLLTIGEDGDEQGNILGLHLQIFDVSDMRNPQRVQHELIPRAPNSYNYSEALYDHHAFTYHDGSQLLVIPFSEYNWAGYNASPFSGVLVYKVDAEKGFERIGTVDHTSLINGNTNQWWVNLSRSRLYFKTAGQYDKDAYLYTISNMGTKVNDIHALGDELPAVPWIR